MIFQPNLIANITEPTTRGNGNFHHPSSYVTHHIGRFQCPLTTPRRSTVFLAHFFSNQEPFSGPVKKLTVLHVGSPEPPNLSHYSGTCTVLEFAGHLSSTNAVFGMISQLPKLLKATIFIGPNQQHYFSEAYTRVSVCPSVKNLKIVMDLEYFYSFQHYNCNNNEISRSQCSNGTCLSNMQYSLIHLVESLLIHAKDSFPNLKTLIVELPENDTLCKTVQSLIQSCHGLRQKTQAAVQQVLPGGERNQDYSAHYGNEGCWAQNDFQRNQQANVSDAFAQFYHHHQQPATMPGNPNQPNYYHEYQYNSNGTSRQARFSPIDDSAHLFHSQPRQQRPPPGFSPLPFIGDHDDKENVGERQFKHRSMQGEKTNHHIHKQQELDVHQRVNTWLSTLET